MSTLDMTWERLLVSPPTLRLKTLEDEYLHEFIRAGGSAVRVVTGAGRSGDRAAAGAETAKTGRTTMCRSESRCAAETGKRRICTNR